MRFRHRRRTFGRRRYGRRHFGRRHRRMGRRLRIGYRF